MILYGVQLPNSLIAPYSPGRAQCCLLSQAGFKVPTRVPSGNDEFVHT